MKAKKRYFLLLLCLLVAFLVALAGLKLSENRFVRWKASRPRVVLEDFVGHPSYQEVKRSGTATCRMETCFNLTRCRHKPFKVYVYPPDEKSQISDSYSKVLNTLTESHYYTDNQDEACIFVLAVDTLDRDPLSNSDYVSGVKKKLKNLPSWNGGLNHVIFNLMAGTYPDYTEDLGFETGKAILAKASISNTHYRPGFDVSIPLFQKNHPERGGEPGRAQANTFPVRKKHFLAFKGKRYVYGIGSETRNSFYHLHNRNDIVLVTTCKHGKNWRELQDERCDEDNLEYDRWDFNDLLSNSTFCLVPRGRRLGSYRFIETLQAGCVPVLLSNGWRLPFAEVIDWSQAALQADERLLLQVPELLHSVPQSKVFAMRQQTQILWDKYLSSVEKIVHTTIEIIRERVYPEESREGLMWNSAPGALWTRRTFSDATGDYPFSWAECALSNNHSGCENDRCHKIFSLSPGPLATLKPQVAASDDLSANMFTAVIYSTSFETLVQNNAPIFKVVKNVAASKYVQKIVILWTSDMPFPPPRQWPGMQPRFTPIHVIKIPANQTSQRFQPNILYTTSAILSLDDDALITTEEIDFAFGVWKQFPDRIVGFPARSHFWSEKTSAWAYTSRWLNDYSMVLTGAAFIHRYYFHIFSEYLAPSFLNTVDQAGNCEDILMNFLVSHVTRRPPIKVTQRKSFKDSNGKHSMPFSHFSERQTCLNTFVAGFGYMPLIRSSIRYDPILFKDSVSNYRKKYRKLEQIQIVPGA